MTGEVIKKIARRYLMAGLLIWLPIIATVWVFRVILDLMDRTLLLLPPSVRPHELFGFDVPGLHRGRGDHCAARIRDGSGDGAPIALRESRYGQGHEDKNGREKTHT